MIHVEVGGERAVGVGCSTPQTVSPLTLDENVELGTVRDVIQQ